MLPMTDIQTSVVDHCNNRCACCSVMAPISEPWFLSPDAVLRDSRVLAKIMHTKRWKFLGGEPFLHPDLDAILDIAGASGLADRIQVTTNGRLLSAMPSRFWDRKRFDILHVSLYANTPVDVLPFAQRQAQALGFELTSCEYRYFFTVRDAEPKDEAYTKLRFDVCPWRWNCNEVRDGYFYRCSHALHFAKLFLRQPEASQGLALSGLTEAGLQQYLDRKEPETACRICNNSGRQIHWHQARDREDWLRSSVS